MKINEIFYSIQGETSKSGLPTVFIRTAGCSLRCSWCDTSYAFEEVVSMDIEEVVHEVKLYKCNNILLTGGEPLDQSESFTLMNRLSDSGYNVSVETGGHKFIGDINERTHIIMDIKCPSSGMSKSNNLDNIYHLKESDEVKFVISTKEDYDYAVDLMKNLTFKSDILFSPVFRKINPQTIIEWILRDNLNVRFQMQMHKIIWGGKVRGK